VFTVQRLEETEFVGTYRFTQAEPGPVPSDSTQFLFGEEFEVELSIDPENTQNGRVFTTVPYPASEEGSLAPVTVPIALARTAIVTVENQGTGIGCGTPGGLAFGSPRSSDNLVEIDINDDSQFTLVLTENVNIDCNVGPGDIVLFAEKID
jgi:hypothetical protein